MEKKNLDDYLNSTASPSTYYVYNTDGENPTDDFSDVFIPKGGVPGPRKVNIQNKIRARAANKVARKQRRVNRANGSGR